ncbi:hypothetical protein Tco_1133033 [Tanacetum coccineum]|uniref:Uncharacterized protein n=1 Tax=Tanacetum coccineum TaxID=301880 RepID=A0ABQ5JGB9_9ASTR
MKAAFYPDVSLEQLVPDQFWIEEECKYDIAMMYGISHWWFQRQRFYIDRLSSEGDRRAVRTHMRILSVVQIKVFSLDFKYMYPSDFEDLYLLNLQGHLNHLSPDDKKVLTTAVNLWTRNLVIRQRVEDFQLGIKNYQTQLNLTKPRWDATGFEFKHDYKVIDSPRVVTFRDRYGVQMIMRDEYKILDEERRYQKQGVHARYPEMAKDTTYLPESGELYWWTDSRRRLPIDEALDYPTSKSQSQQTKSTQAGSPPSMCQTISNIDAHVEGEQFHESKQSSYKDGKVRYSFPRSRQSRRDLPRDNPLVSVEVLRNRVNTYAVRITWLIADVEDKYHGPMGLNPLVHSFRALSTLRRSGLRTASAAAKPCQGNSSEFYLITGRIPTVAAAGKRHVYSQPHAHTSYS